MYKVASKLDLKMFENKTLLQACFGENEVILNFDQELSLRISSELRCVSGDADQKFQTPKQSASSVLEALGKTTIKAEGDGDGTLRIYFDGKTFFEIYDDSDQYEAFEIRNGKEVIPS